MKRPEPESDHSPKPLLRNTVVQSYNFPVILQVS